MAERRRSRGLGGRIAAGLAFAAVAAAMTAGMIVYAGRRRGRAPGPQSAFWPAPGEPGPWWSGPIPAGRTVPAAFQLPRGKRVLVFPDDMYSPVTHPAAKRELVEKVNEMLLRKRLAVRAVRYDELDYLEATEPQFDQWAVATVGRKLQADLVIYILLEPLTLKHTLADTLWHGRFAGRVRVVDVRKGRIWPEDPAGRLVRVVEQPSDDPSSTYHRQLVVRLAEKLGEKIGNLFVEHPEETMPTPDWLDPPE